MYIASKSHATAYIGDPWQDLLNGLFIIKSGLELDLWEWAKRVVSLSKSNFSIASFPPPGSQSLPLFGPTNFIVRRILLNMYRWTGAPLSEDYMKATIVAQTPTGSWFSMHWPAGWEQLKPMYQIIFHAFKLYNTKLAVFHMCVCSHRAQWEFWFPHRERERCYNASLFCNQACKYWTNQSASDYLLSDLDPMEHDVPYLPHFMVLRYALPQILFLGSPSTRVRLLEGILGFHRRAEARKLQSVGNKDLLTEKQVWIQADFLKEKGGGEREKKTPLGI